MYIIDRIEHGNCDVMNTKILDELPLKDALKKRPQDYHVYTKEWGFWPVICRGKDANKPSFYWDGEDNCWKRYEK